VAWKATGLKEIVIMKKLILAIIILAAGAGQLFAGSPILSAGDEYHEKFKNAEALKLYKQAYDADPDNFEACFKMVRAYIDTGEDTDSEESEKYYVKAVESAREMVKKYPDKADSHYMLALAIGKLALFKGGKEKVKMSRAIERSAKKALEIDPGAFRPYLLLGVYYREIANLNWLLKMFAKTFFGGLPEGTNEDSEKMLLKSIKLNGKFPRSYYELAETYEVMGRTSDARRNYRKVIDLPVADHLDKSYKEKARKKLSNL